MAVRVDGSHLVITFADGSHDTETLPAGSGIDSTARAAAVAAQSAADGAQALATQNETDKLEPPDLVAGIGIALIPSGSRELTISTTGSISGPEELEGGQWRWVNTALADADEVMYAGDVVLGQIDTWTFLASGAFFPSQAQLSVLLPGDTITIRQNTNRYQTIEVTSEPTVANNFVTVRGYADRANHAEIPQAFANVTIIISPGPLQGEDKTARDAAAAAQADIDQHETNTHNTDANARLAAQGAHVLAGQVQTDLNLHEHNHPTQGDDAFEWATEGNTDVIPTGKVNLDAVQNQIDDIHEQIAHSTGEISEVVGVLGAGNDSLRYTLPVNLDGVYDVSVRVKAKVQVNEFVTFTGNLHITVDGGLGLNAEIPSKTHNYHNTHTGVLNFLRKGLSISPGASHIDFSTLVTGSSPPNARFIEVENLTITNTSLVNSSNVNPFIADWAEEGNTDDIPDSKLGAVRIWARDAAPVLIGSATVPPGLTPFTIRLTNEAADAFYAAYNAGTYPSGYRIDVQWVSGSNHHALTANLSPSLWSTMVDGQTYQYHIDAGAALDSTSTRIVNFSRAAAQDYVEFQTLPVSDDLESGAVFSVWGLA